MITWIVAVKVERNKQDHHYDPDAWIETDYYCFYRFPEAISVDVPPTINFNDWAGLRLIHSTAKPGMFFPVDGFFSSGEVAQEAAKEAEEEDDWYLACPLDQVEGP
jgi:hypothetical protein